MTLVGGDFLAEVPVEADLYVLKSVLQHWDDAAARAILESCREAMPAQSRLVIVERLLPERSADDPAAAMLDLHMMVITGGRVRTRGEFEHLLTEAGLTLSRVVAHKLRPHRDRGDPRLTRHSGVSRIQSASAKKLPACRDDDANDYFGAVSPG